LVEEVIVAVRKRPAKAKKGLDLRYYPNERDARKCQSALQEYDRVVRGYEAKWGIDRLPDLVDAEMRERWWQQWDKLNAAIERGSGPDLEHAVEVTIRACGVLEARAIELGAKPLTGDRWECELPDGGVMAIVRDAAEIANVQRGGSYDCVYCVAEVGRIVQQWRSDEAGRAAERVKAVFEGAEVVGIAKRKPTPLEKELNDEIPF
jgi:hypothetical protein